MTLFPIALALLSLAALRVENDRDAIVVALVAIVAAALLLHFLG